MYVTSLHFTLYLPGLFHITKDTEMAHTAVPIIRIKQTNVLHMYSKHILMMPLKFNKNSKY